MPRSVATLVNNNFSKGLITETSPFTFPQGACAETFDCIHNITGSVERRSGFEFEINNSTKVIDRADGVVVSYLWKDVAGDGNTSFVVLQVKDHLYFYNGSTTEALSAHAVSSNIDLNTFISPGAPDISTQECQFASGNGKLFVAHPYTESFYVDYDTLTNTFSATQIDIQIRDFEGLTTDTYAVDERPSTGLSGLPVAHKYNLLNQGWSQTNLNTWDNNRSDLPSNADVMWTFKNSSNAFDISTVANVVQGNSPAPKGHYVLNLYDQDRASVSNLVIPTVTSGYQRASTIAFFSGRLFFSGINYTGFNSSIYFTQIIERDTQYGSCYQTNDPTSETLFDILASDGGVIKIQEAGTIHKLFPVPGGLAVFASNGVWLVTGSTGLGFAANDYSVAKISSISTVSHTSFVDVAGTPIWWNLEGIYRMDQGQGGAQIVPMTADTIKTFYDTIPPSEKRNARGFFNPLAYTVQWLYRTTEAGDLNTYYEYDRVLNLDIRSGAFFVWTIPVHDVKVHGMVVLENRGGDVSLVNVTDNALVNVTALDGSTVQVWTIGDSIVTPSFKYIISYNDGFDNFTFAETRNNTDFLDWKLYDATGTDFTSYFISGITLPNSMTDFESNYVNLYTDANTKLYVQGQWDFSNSGNSGRWSNQQVVDTTQTTNYDSVISRRKIRGRGKALQIKIESYPTKYFYIDGWGTFLTSNQMP